MKNDFIFGEELEEQEKNFHIKFKEAIIKEYEEKLIKELENRYQEIKEFLDKEYSKWISGNNYIHKINKGNTYLEIRDLIKNGDFR